MDWIVERKYSKIWNYTRIFMRSRFRLSNCEENTFGEKKKRNEPSTMGTRGIIVALMAFVNISYKWEFRNTFETLCYMKLDLRTFSSIVPLNNYFSHCAKMFFLNYRYLRKAKLFIETRSWTNFLENFQRRNMKTEAYFFEKREREVAQLNSACYFTERRFIQR